MNVFHRYQFKTSESPFSKVRSRLTFGDPPNESERNVSLVIQYFAGRLYCIQLEKIIRVILLLFSRNKLLGPSEVAFESESLQP